MKKATNNASNSSLSETEVGLSSQEQASESLGVRIPWYRHPRTLAAVLLCSFIGIVISQQSNNPSRAFAAGLKALRSGDNEQLTKAIEALEGIDQYKLQREFFLGAEQLIAGNHEAALRLLSPCFSHPDLEVDAHVLAGQAAYQLGAAGNAKLHWEEALRVDPLSVSAHRWLGAMYYDLGAMDNAILHLQAVSMLVPEDPRPDRLIALINHDYERPDEAIPHYEETLRRDPNQSDVDDIWLEFAECQLKQREYDAAVESLGHCEDSPRKDRLFAECQMNLGELEQAKMLAQRALENAPKDIDVLQLNSQIALIDGDVEQSIQWLFTASEIDPYKHSVRTQLAQLLGRVGRDEESSAQARIAEELQQKWQRFSDLQIDAINQMTNAAIRHEIGVLASQLGKPELAATWFRAALAIDPGYAPSAEALQSLGGKASADASIDENL